MPLEMLENNKQGNIKDERFKSVYLPDENAQ